MEDSTLLNGYPFELDNFDPDVDQITSEVVEAGSSTRPIGPSLGEPASRYSTNWTPTDHELAATLEAHMTERPEAYAVRQIIRRLCPRRDRRRRSETRHHPARIRPGLAH